MAVIPTLKLVAPTNKKRTVGRKANAKYRTREHLTEREVERLVEAAKGNRWGHRDATMMLIAFRHGLRASEVVDLLSKAASCTCAESNRAHRQRIP